MNWLCLVRGCNIPILRYRLDRSVIRAAPFMAYLLPSPGLPHSYLGRSAQPASSAIIGSANSGGN